jgi:hypothetical protein
MLTSQPSLRALRHAFFQTAVLLLSACSDPQSSEQRVRNVIAGMQAAAEARDASDFMEFVATDFRNSSGQGFEDVQRYLRGYLLTHQSIHLLTRIEQLEFPVPQEAQVILSVGMAGKQVGGGAMDMAANLYEFKLVLREESGDWKVINGAWRQR